MAVAPKYIVHRERRFVYAVVPKVACTSIKAALAPLFDPDVDATAEKGRAAHALFNDAQMQGLGWQIGKADYLKGRTQSGSFGDFFSFAFVRNPFDRLLSCWQNKLHKPLYGGWSHLKRGDGPLYFGMPFAEFVEVVSEMPDEAANPHFRSQSVALCHDGERLPGFVGRFERLTEDWLAVSERIGAGRLPHLVKSSGNPGGYQRYYNHRTRSLVEERFAGDLDTFDYGF